DHDNSSDFFSCPTITMEYLVQKWKMWFNMIDLNHHKKIAKADVSQAESTFMDLSHLDADKRKETLAAMDKWWNEYIFRGKPGPITEKIFVDALMKDYKADKKAFVDWVKRLLKDVYDIIDVDHDGSMTEEEYVNAFRSIGHETAQDVRFFNAYKPVRGKIPVSQLTDSWVQFLTSEDKTQPDVVRDVLQSGF
uniref:hypothetical protein n=1 Tax=Klebsiella pneumoniae TaxID=573 RepID=UPI0027D24E85